MELGNLFTGRPQGNYPIERGVGWEEELVRLFDAYAPDRDNSWREYGVEFENDVFAVFPYYWDGCTCGYEEQEDQWDNENRHDPGCYQVAVAEAMTEWLAQNPEPAATPMNVSFEKAPKGMVVVTAEPACSPSADAWREWASRREAARTAIYDRLCAEFGLDRKYGCAVHCTCTYQERWQRFCTEHSHAPSCPIIKPNFLYKPTGYSIQWYKYPLRDSYASDAISLVAFRAMVDKCIKSLGETT